VWQALLVDVSAAEPGEAEAGYGRGVVIRVSRAGGILTNRYKTEDEDDDLDDDDDFDDDTDDRGGEDGDDGDEDEDEDDDEEDEETWQVRFRGIPLKGASGLTSGIELPRLAEIFQPS
jgi:hypothetical protein